MSKKTLDNGDTIIFPLPNDMTFQEAGQRLQFDWKWNSQYAIIYIIIGLLCPTSIAISMVVGVEFYKSYILLYLISYAELLLGIFLIYLGIVKLINQTTLIVTKNEIMITHKPLPWLGIKSINRNKIKQLYVIEKFNRGNVSYSLSGLQQNGSHFTLISNIALPSLEAGKFLEQKIEAFWEIQNFSVEEEVN